MDSEGADAPLNQDDDASLSYSQGLAPIRGLGHSILFGDHRGRPERLIKETLKHELHIAMECPNYIFKRVEGRFVSVDGAFPVSRIQRIVSHAIQSSCDELKSINLGHKTEDGPSASETHNSATKVQLDALHVLHKAAELLVVELSIRAALFVSWHTNNVRISERAIRLVARAVLPTCDSLIDIP